MIFHEPDTTYKNLKQCWKRANALAKPLPWYYEMFVDVSNHPLHVQLENMKQAIPDDELPDLALLDWFAVKIDEFAKTNLIANDRIARDCLWQWKEMMFIDPTRMK